MAQTHVLSRALTPYLGDVYYPRYHTADGAKSGLVASIPIWVDLGVPLTLDTNAFVAAATGAELPNASTKTYTTADAAVSPIDDAGLPATSSVVMANGTTQSVWAQDVPRNLSMVVTHGSSIVAISCLISGYDVYGEAMSETLSVTATGTSKTSAGKKAFKWIKSIALTSASDATADTVNLGFGDVIGLPFAVDRKDRLIPIGDGALDASATIVVADATDPATTTTGDTRGTIDFNSASDGTRKFACWLMPTSRQTQVGSFGVTQV